MSTAADVHVFDSPESMFRGAAGEVAKILNAAIAARGAAAIALSGGSTPKALYKLLAQGEGGGIDWSRVQVFFSDERCVPPDHTDSNYRMAQESWFTGSKVPEANIHRIQGELEPEQAANLYEQELKRAISEVDPDGVPRFDLILLGMGPDGHTASLFPASEALEVADHLVVANWVEKLNSFRVTFTLPLIDAAANVMFLVVGKEKQDVLKKVLAGDRNYPSARVRPLEGRLMWMLDQAAADDAD